MKIDERHRHATSNVPLAAVAAALLALPACGDGEADAGDDGPGDASGPLYAVQHNINAPDGRLVYMSLIPSLDEPGDAISVENAIEISGYAAVQAFGGAVFVAENETLAITRWDIDADGRPVPGPQVSFANEALSTFWNDNFLYVDSETVWYANDAAQEIIVWNPRTMEITGKIAVDGLDMSTLPVSFHGLTRVDDRVFMPVSFVDWDSYQAHPAIVMVVFSVADQQVSAIWEDTRCAIPASVLPNLNVTSDGTLYVLGDAFYGTWLHGGTPAVPPSCAIRVLPGADGFDPDWSVSLDGSIEGYGDMATLVIDDARGRVYTDLMKQPDEPFETVEALWDWQVVPDNTRRVSCSFPGWDECEFADEEMDGSRHWFSAKIDGRVLMTSLREANNDTVEFGECAVYDMTADGPRELFETAGFVSNIVRVR